MADSRKHLFVLNPAAGKRDTTDQLAKHIRELGSARGLDFTIGITQGRGHATELAREFAQSGDEVRIYACGGDGTLNEVVNGAAGWMNAAVTHVPCGSGNDFVRLFSEPAAFADFGRLMDPDEATFDVIRANDRLSLGVCSVGLDARIGADMIKYKHLPLVTGSGAYALSIVANLFRGIHEQYHVRIDDEELDGRYTLACICNGRWYGGGYYPIPEAEPDDGLMDVLLVKAVSRPTVVRVIGKYKVGRWKELTQYATYRRCRQITLDAAQPMTVNTDGEMVHTTHVTFSIEPKQMRFFYPKGLSYAAKPVAAGVR